jgi:leucyl-tRNA synthetase
MFKFYETLALLNAPIVPHFSEKLWKKLGKENLVFDQSFPQPKKIDQILLDSKNHLFDFIKLVRKNQNKSQKKKLFIYLTQIFPPYYTRSIEIIKNNLDQNKIVKNKNLILKLITQEKENLKYKKEIINCIPFLLTEYEKTMDSKLFDLHPPFDEFHLFNNNKEIIINELDLESLEIISVDTNSLEKYQNLKFISKLMPLKPIFELK